MVGSADHSVADVARFYFDPTINEERSAALADAERFVACWNSCAGISTDALERRALQALLEQLRVRREGCPEPVRAALAKLEGKP